MRTLPLTSIYTQDDGGMEHSARIAEPGDANYYEVYAQKTATKLVKGKIGDPHGATWAVELALAYSDIFAKVPRGQKPIAGDRFRINFSRVENEGDTNWTWQPQRIWDAEQGRVAGKLAMHLPDAWGYVEFAPPGSGIVGEIPKERLDSKTRDPSWPARLTVMNIYYAQRRYHELHDGQYAPDLSALKGLFDPWILEPFLDPKTGNSVSILLSDDGKGYFASAIDSGRKIKATVSEQRLLTSVYIGKGNMADG
jgi:hypothetical protein